MNSDVTENACLAAAFDTLEVLKKAPKDVSAERVVAALQALPSHYRETEGETEMQGIRGAPDWLGYEMRLWELSEVIRVYLGRKRGMRGRCEVLDAVAEIASHREYGKGRQNFVLLLSQYGGQGYSDVLGGLLDDTEVHGHAVKGLTRLKEHGYAGKIESILCDSKVGWVKAAARKYLRDARQ